jgi:Domain of unknown function (DUF4139)
MKSLPSALEAVTVFREGAVCRRVGQAPPSNDRALRFGRLPMSLEPGSLRARVLNGGNQVIDVRAQFEVESVDEFDLPAEQRALARANERVAALEVRAQRSAQEIDELRRLRPTFLASLPGAAPRPAPVEAIIALTAFTDAELAQRFDRVREMHDALAGTRADQALHAQRVSEASTAQRGERSKIWRLAVIMLAHAPTEPLEVELTYSVPGARWVPSYSLTLEEGLSKGTLKMRASIAQCTGEDWSKVHLSLSTTIASRDARLPELKALKLGRHQELPKKSGWREPPPGLDSLFEAFDTQCRPDVLQRSDVLPPPKPSLPSSSRGRGAVPEILMALTPAAAPAPARSNEDAMKRRPPVSVFGEGRTSDAAVGFSQAEPHVEAAPTWHGLGSGFDDFARLVLATAEHPIGVRGRLVPVDDWAFQLTAASIEIRAVSAAVSQAQRGAAAIATLPLPAATLPVAAVQSFDYRYDCDGQVDVPSTERWTLVNVMTCGVALSPEYVCLPSIEPTVYRTLTINNFSPHALLPGPVDVTAGDEFLMTTTLPGIAPGNERSHRMGLGVEEAIKVARKTQFKEAPGGFLGGSTVLAHEVTIELNNRLSLAALVEVRERVPTVDPTEKDVKVEDVRAAPPWEDVEGPVDGTIVKGGRRWRVALEPGQMQTLSAHYSIRMPADRMLVGGNRRD